MTDAISKFVCELFQNNSIIATVIISMIPLIELRGAIPFAMSKQFWGSVALSGQQAMLFSFLGSSFVVPIIALIFKPIYKAIKDKKAFKSIIHFLTGNAEKKSVEIQNDCKGKTGKKQLFIKIIGVMLFVAIPLPLTGVYTGTCLAIFLGLNFWVTCGAVIIGNFFTGLIMTTICSVFPEFTNIILYIFLALIVLFMIIRIIVHFAEKKKKKELTD